MSLRAANWLILLGVFLIGCAGTPGHVDFSESQMDGRKTLMLTPGWAGDLQLGLFKTSEMDSNVVLLTVRAWHVCSNDWPNQIRFKFDGNIETLADNSEFSRCEVSDAAAANYTERTFFTDRTFVERFLNAKDVLVAWGPIETKPRGGPTTAISGFREFLAQMDSKGMR